MQHDPEFPHATSRNRAETPEPYNKSVSLTIYSNRRTNRSKD